MVVLYNNELTPGSRVLPENVILHQLQKFHATEQFPSLSLSLPTRPSALFCKILWLCEINALHHYTLVLYASKCSSRVLPRYFLDMYSGLVCKSQHYEACFVLKHYELWSIPQILTTRNSAVGFIATSFTS